MCTYETKQGFDSELSTKHIHKNSSPLTAHESQFSDKQKFHIAPKMAPIQYWILGELTVCDVNTFNNTICLMIIILKRRAQHLLYEIIHLHIIGDFPLHMWINT